ncbi:MAG: gliding motility lipoprotein GldD [Bacteroidetes bacterium]|nr:gliding motility lipoprotein GldD [Bacteroidota bacterium]
MLAACSGGETYVPKPRGYPRIDFPAKDYQMLQLEGLPYRFEAPGYAKLEKDTTANLTSGYAWYNLNFKPYNATLHITYYKFSDWEFFDSLVYDTRKLVNKHLQRAEDIVEKPLSLWNPELKGVMFDIQGNTATNLNFYVTDSSRHFLRAALYFNRQTQRDSIEPVFQFLKQDVAHILNTFHWN